MAGDLLDEPSALCAVAREVGLDTDAFQEWLEDPEVEEELRADMEAARHPSRAARALDHKLADWDDGRRYTCPSYLMETPEGESLDLPGWQPPETYETALANLIPDVERQPLPESAEEVLRWAGEPLATAEVASLLERDLAGAHEDLAGVAEKEPVGADGYWTLASS